MGIWSRMVNREYDVSNPRPTCITCIKTKRKKRLSCRWRSGPPKDKRFFAELLNILYMTGTDGSTVLISCKGEGRMFVHVVHLCEKALASK